MALKRLSKFAAVALTAAMIAEAGLSSFVPLTVEAKEAVEAQVEEAAVNAAGDDNFTWDNATVYFVLTDRFYNGNKTNDHSYGRSVDEVDAASYATRKGTFHGGDLAGLTAKIKEGYFDDLGVNAMWISCPYENSHGAICAEGFKHYAYHGYYALDFSQLDANMGTDEEMAEFVRTAHEHGIRVVYDVVMNHVGYADPVTVSQYNAGALNTGWEDIYYATSESDYHWYMDYSTETQNGKATLNSEGDWSKWWSNKWVRAVTKRFKGYEGAESGDDTKLCTGGLPDIKTEDSSDNGIPPILKSKWDKEGTTATKTAELDAFFTEYGLPRRNVNYVVAWLSSYVEKYGIDGFRCDTAKHIETEHWATLHKICDQRLKKWRAAEKQKANPDPACNWDEDFWMTGEVFGYSGGKNNYFTSGAFDSLINFGFQGVSGQSGSALEQTYSGYAASINSDPSYNMLSYISSHDKGFGARGAAAGTALLLCPGAVQIYYGDEYGRGTQGDQSEQNWRSQMEFGKNENILSNWQKVGQFRNNHPAVGAGTHTKIDGDVYEFSRVYGDDKVVVALPNKAGTFNVKVSGVFEDGEVITDAYSKETYTVSGGSVSVTCDSNGVILLEGSGEVKPYVSGKITKGSSPFSTETIEVTLSAFEATESFYSINGGEKVAYKDGDVIEIGAGSAYDEVTKVALSGKAADGTALSKELTYTKCSEPTVSGAASIKVAKSEFATAPFCYAYDSADKALNGAWPGAAMTAEGDYWAFTPSTDEDFSFILSDGNGWRSTADMQPGLVTSGNSLYTKSTGKVTTLPVKDKAKVTVKYVDADGKELKTGVYRVGAVGDTYETSAPAVLNGLTLDSDSKNTTGTFTKEEITVTYYYGGTPIATNTPVPTNPDATNTPVPTNPDATNTPVPTNPDATNTPAPTEPVPTGVVGEFELLGVNAEGTLAAGKEITLKAMVDGDTSGVRYMFTYEKDGKEILIQNFQSEKTMKFTPAVAGKYKFKAYAILNGNIQEVETNKNIK